jgi:hypothetical protein
MGTTPDQRETPERMSEPALPAASGVRTEHQLRTQLRDALRRNTRYERALRESAEFAYGRREIADLRRLRAVLASVGYPDPASVRTREANAAAEQSEMADS